ncbi:MAG: histidine kinase dimerization/phosphoacceptor domain-containing protein, partial [Rectinema sp.]
MSLVASGGVRSGNVYYRKMNTGKLLGYALYAAAVVFFSTEFASFNAAGIIRSSEYLLGTFAICLILLVISSVLLQLSNEFTVQVSVFGFCFVLMALIEHSFSIFQFTELSFFCGFLILLNSKFHPPVGLGLSLLLIIMYLFPYTLTASLGKNDLLNLDTMKQDFLIRLGGSIFLTVSALGSSFIRQVFEKKAASDASVQHLNMTIEHLSKINQDLQSYARTIDEEAIASERNRISREIHDISGYRFTNIIALMDAAMSMGGRNPEKLQELYIAARSQAKDGILETRRALQALRTDELYRKRGIAAIYKICSVFHEVTGIK